MKWLWAIVGVFAVAVVGCMAKVTVDKRPNLALPVYSESGTTNPVEYVIVDQGYLVKYSKFGFSTDIESMSAEIHTNRTVSFNIGGLHSHYTNSVSLKLDDLLKVVQLFRESGIASTNIVVELPDAKQGRKDGLKNGQEQ